MVSDRGLIYKMSISGELLMTKIKTFYYFHLDYKTACFFFSLSSCYIAIGLWFYVPSFVKGWE